MMTGLVRKATLLSVCGLLGASVAMAGVPDAAHSAIGVAMPLVGTTSGTPDVKGQKLIIVKDAGGTPVQNSTVTISFLNAAAADIRLCTTQPFAGVGVSCPNKEVVALTDATGTATFRVVGFAVNPGGGVFNAPAPGYGANGASVKADGVPLGTLTVSAFDENGTSGVNTVDIALFLNDRFSFNPGNAVATERGRSDFDGNGLINPVDLALILGVRGAGGSSVSCAAACP
jgi:hypothetical protein